MKTRALLLGTVAAFAWAIVACGDEDSSDGNGVDVVVAPAPATDNQASDEQAIAASAVSADAGSVDAGTD